MNREIQEWDKAAQSYSEFEATSQYSIFCRDFIANHFDIIQKLIVLDAGCGNGEHTHILTQNGANVIGCDGSIEMLKIAKSKYPSYKFDLVNLLENMPY